MLCERSKIPLDILSKKSSEYIYHTRALEHLPTNIAVPSTIPIPLTASGRTNILEPTVFPVTNREADNTFVMASILLGSLRLDNKEDASSSVSILPSVATDRDVICDDLSYFCIEDDRRVRRVVPEEVLARSSSIIELAVFISRTTKGGTKVLLFLVVYCRVDLP